AAARLEPADVLEERGAIFHDGVVAPARSAVVLPVGPAPAATTWAGTALLRLGIGARVVRVLRVLRTPRRALAARLEAEREHLAEEVRKVDALGARLPEEVAMQGARHLGADLARERGAVL